MVCQAVYLLLYVRMKRTIDYKSVGDADGRLIAISLQMYIILRCKTNKELSHVYSIVLPKLILFARIFLVIKF